MDNIIFYTNLEQALAARKAAADEGTAEAFGTTFTTPALFLRDAWEVWGDGRTIVSASERCLLLLEVLSEYPALSHIAFDVRPLASFVGRFAGAPCFDDAVRAEKGENDGVAHIEGLGATERMLFAAIGVYLDCLDARDLIEAGHAARLLEGTIVPEHVTFDTWQTLSPALMSLIESVAGAPAESLLPDPRIDRAAETPDATFLFPAGPCAVLPMIKDEIGAFCSAEQREKAVGQGEGTQPVRIAVCAQDPHAAYDALAPYFAERGWTCRLLTSVPFAATAFGRACEAAYALITEDEHWRCAVTDFAYGIFSGMSAQAARRLDSAVRGDRLMACEHARELLSEQSSLFGAFVGLFGDDPLSFLALIRQHAYAMAATHDMVAEIAACDALTATLQQYEQLQVKHVPLIDAMRLLSVAEEKETPQIPQAQQIMQDACPAQTVQIEIRPLTDQGNLVQAAYDLVILGDMSDASMRRSSSRVAYDALAEKLGFAQDDSHLNSARVAFICAERAARTQFTCVMPLRNAERDAAYPSVVFNEYVHALRRGDEPVDAAYFDVPCRIVETSSMLGEDDIAACLGHGFYEPDDADTIVFPHAARGKLEELSLIDFLPLADATARGAVATRIPVMSPSAIETYVDCPYCWFVQSRLCLSDIDEGFGPAEKGTFVHDAFARLFDELAVRGVHRINADSLDEAQALLDEICDEIMRAQADTPGHRLAPATRSEALEVDVLRKNMHTCLSRQANLPQTFDVYAHELEITPDAGVDYAGVRLNGRVDRIDVDEAAHRFVVLDYKGSLAGHAAGFPESADAETFTLPHKMQALIYARAMRNCHSRFDEYAAVGALYLSYSARRARDCMAGSYNELAYDVDGMAPASSRVSMNFDAFLDLVEEKTTDRLQALKQGNIRQNALDKDVCRQCAVTTCTGRQQ